MTGISGSGKSTLMKNIIKDNLQNKRLIHCDEIKNQNYIEEIIEVDQSQIGKSSRSCIASYIDIFDEIRKIFASQLISKERGLQVLGFHSIIKKDNVQSVMDLDL